MKKIKFLFLAILGLLFVNQTSQAQGKFDKWPEIKEFHKVMSQTFHPAEEGNLTPIKTRSTEMVNKAQILAKSKIPAEFDNKAVKKAIKDLVKGSKALDKLVKKNAPDEEIKKAIFALHDTFHQVVDKCQPGHDHDH